ncbi:MAG: ATPase, partial [Gammaproteobacteria bacterium]|nr:ATPase [Gammaproteobacteria bacterium]
EKKTMYEVPHFINQSLKDGYAHFINDAGGSLCELEDKKLYQLLSEKTLIIYIKTSKENERLLIDRAKSQPKPMYYNPKFFEGALHSYLKENSLAYAAQINPNAFVTWVFPKLVADRLKKYSALADKYGCTIESDALHKCNSAKDVLNLISSALK